MILFRQSKKGSMEMNKSKKNETERKEIPESVRAFVDFYFKVEGDVTGWDMIVKSSDGDDYCLRTMYLDDVLSSDELYQLTDNALDEILDYAENTSTNGIFRDAFVWMNEKGLI